MQFWKYTYSYLRSFYNTCTPVEQTTYTLNLGIDLVYQ